MFRKREREGSSRSYSNLGSSCFFCFFPGLLVSWSNFLLSPDGVSQGWCFGQISNMKPQICLVWIRDERNIGVSGEEAKWREKELRAAQLYLWNEKHEQKGLCNHSNFCYHMNVWNHNVPHSSLEMESLQSVVWVYFGVFKAYITDIVSFSIYNKILLNCNK